MDLVLTRVSVRLLLVLVPLGVLVVVEGVRGGLLLVAGLRGVLPVVAREVLLPVQVVRGVPCSGSSSEYLIAAHLL